MKKKLLIVFLFSAHFTFAKMGTTNDGILLILAICVVLILILSVLFSIDLIRNAIKHRKEKKVMDAKDAMDIMN